MTKEDIISIPMNRLRQKHSPKATKKLSESKDVQYLGIAIHVESFFSAWSVKEVAELQTFCTRPVRDWRLRRDSVNHRGMLVSGGEMVSPHTPRRCWLIVGGTILPVSTTSEEMVIETIVEKVTERTCLEDFQEDGRESESHNHSTL